MTKGVPRTGSERAARVLSLALACLCFSLVPAKNGFAAARPSYGGTATVAADGPIRSRDPALATTEAERMLASAVHCTLADLVAAIEPLGGTSFRIRLKDNILFHDGTRILAADVARSLERVDSMSPASPAAWRLLVLARGEEGDGRIAVQATGDSTLEVEVLSPDLPLLSWLDDPGLAITKADGATGCGPFVATSRRTDRQSSAEALEPRLVPASMLLIPFERHATGRPFLDQLFVVPLEGDRAIEGRLRSFDTIIGELAPEEGTRSIPDRSLVSLRVSSFDGRGDALRSQLSSLMEREALTRLFMERGARPLFDLSSLVTSGEDGSAKGREPLVPADQAVMISHEGGPMQQRLAERVQLRLHDAGIRATIAKGGEAPASASQRTIQVTIDVHEPLPSCPLMKLVAIAHRHGGSDLASSMLRRLLEDGSDESSLVSAARFLETELSLVPLATRSGRVWLSEDIHVSRGEALEVPLPASLWRWPEDLPPPPRKRNLAGW